MSSTSTHPSSHLARPRPKSFGIASCLSVIAFLAVMVAGPNTSGAHEIAKEMSDAANKLLQSLDEAQAKSISFSMEDPQRKDWQFVPMERKGLGLKSMKPHQRGLAMALVQSVLSHKGFATAMEIMSLEQVLRELENNPNKRDPEKYHLFLFGTPSTEQAWGWRIEGHHLSLTVTIVQTDEGQEVFTNPSFFGTNPAEVRNGPMKGVRVLGDIEDAGRDLIKQLSVEQKAKAVIAGKVPNDVINGPGREAELISPEGIAAADLDEKQKKMLRAILDSYLNRFRSSLMDDDREKIELAGFEKLNFAWIGKIQLGEPHYFRIQGPTFIFEYDNTQNQANHAHVVWRDFQNDFGADALRLHYEKTHGSKVGK